MVPPHCTSCRTTSWLFLPDPTLFSCGVPTAAAGDAPDCAAPLPPAAEAAPAGAAELARPATRTAAAVTAPLVTLHRPTKGMTPLLPSGDNRSGPLGPGPYRTPPVRAILQGATR